MSDRAKFDLELVDWSRIPSVEYPADAAPASTSTDCVLVPSCETLHDGGTQCNRCGCRGSVECLEKRIPDRDDRVRLLPREGTRWVCPPCAWEVHQKEPLVRSGDLEAPPGADEEDLREAVVDTVPPAGDEADAASLRKQVAEQAKKIAFLEAQKEAEEVPYDLELRRVARWEKHLCSRIGVDRILDKVHARYGPFPASPEDTGKGYQHEQRTLFTVLKKARDPRTGHWASSLLPLLHVTMVRLEALKYQSAEGVAFSVGVAMGAAYEAHALTLEWSAYTDGELRTAANVAKRGEAVKEAQKKVSGGAVHAGTFGATRGRGGYSGGRKDMKRSQPSQGGGRDHKYAKKD